PPRSPLFPYTTLFRSHQLDNEGTVLWTGDGAVRAEQVSVVNNSGLFEIRTDAPLAYDDSGCGFRCPPGSFNNAGTLRKSAGTGTDRKSTRLNYSDVAM